MNYKNTRGRVPTGQSVTAAKPHPAQSTPRAATATEPRPAAPRASANTHPDSAQNPHTPYSVCPPMNSLMIDVGGIAAISSGESATI